MRLHFLGANRQVTGSCYLLEAAGLRLLIDCGMFQERDYAHRNYDGFRFDPKSIDAVLLTHAHLDHCGLLPKLAKHGYRGPIYTHHASVDLTRLVLADSARLQERPDADEAEEYQGPDPLYTTEHARQVGELFRPVGYDTPTELNRDCAFVLHEAGHVLGSASIEVMVRVNGQPKSVLFSGDIGTYGKPLIRDPKPPTSASFVVLESTYGDAVHEPTDGAESGDDEQPHPKDFAILKALEGIIDETYDAGGKLIIPTFAVERAQEVLYYLDRLRENKRIASMPVYLDSPMAIEVTQLFHKHLDLLDAEAMGLLRQKDHPLRFKGLKAAVSKSESRAINELRGPAIILAGSGMCTGGRVVHHLVRHIDEPENTILFVGYQAHGTLGRDIVDGRSPVRIMDATKTVRARIHQLSGMSGHADRPALDRWLSAMTSEPSHIFLTHGEPDAAAALQAHLKATRQSEVWVPEYGGSIELV